MVLVIFRKKYKFAYKETFIRFLKTLLCTLVMLIVLIGVKLVLNQYLVGGRVISIVSIFIYGIIGVLIYFGVSYKMGLINDIFGKDRINSYLKKLHLRK